MVYRLNLFLLLLFASILGEPTPPLTVTDILQVPRSAAPSLSGTVEDNLKVPIDGAKVTAWDAATGRGLQTLTSKGDFTLSNIAEGDYLLKVESDAYLAVYGALHVKGSGTQEINVVMLSPANGSKDAVGAGAPLRSAVRPPRDPVKPPKVKFPEVKKKVQPVYPEAARKAGIAGKVVIATVLLPNGILDDLVVLSAPNKDLAVAALMAVRQWRYSPSRLDGNPIETNFTIDVDFRQ